MSDTNKDSSNTSGFESAVEEMSNNFKQVEDLMTIFAETKQPNDPDQFNLKEAYAKWFTEAAKNPEKVMQDSMTFWQKSMLMSQQVFMSAFSNDHENKTEPVITEEQGDRRFKHEDWTEKAAFSLIKQSYLLSSEFLRNSVTDVEGLDEKTAEKVKFFTERYLDSLSPTNFAATNPAVIEKVIETKGENLVNGFKNMLADIDESGQLKIKMSDTNAFTLGENIATTPGKVVFQNRMFQLIQYTPTTDKVLKRPLLIIPPWINKFYVLDLQEKNSMLKWMVDEGHTVFIVSWINPDETYKEVSFEDYVTEGVISAVDAIEQATGENEINAIGYCIGGTLLSTSLAYMKAHGDKRIKTATFFTTMIDFSDLGELGVFIDEEQINGLEKVMQEEGYLKGTRMSGSFNLLRANDLIWSFYVNNYLLGNDPRPFDILFWNSDSTRMTPTMHSWYLRNMYQNNNLVKPNKISIKGTPIDISSIDIPVCFVGAEDDHIAPWISTYSGAKLFSGETRFILAGSGHIAGIVNPPAANKYAYRVTDSLPEDAQAWANKAELNAGSWWPNWDQWIREQANDTVKARVEGEGGLKVIEAAPGTYVQCKLDDPSPVVEYTKLDLAKKPVVSKKTETMKVESHKIDAKKTDESVAKKSTAKKTAPKLKAKPEVKQKPVAKSKAKAKSDSKVKPKSKVKSKSEAKPESKAKSKTKASETNKSSAKPAVKKAVEQQTQLNLQTEQPKKTAAEVKQALASNPKTIVSAPKVFENKKAQATTNVKPVVEAKPVASKQVTNTSKVTRPAQKVSKDDLTIIKGIGPKAAEMLSSYGINSFADVAAMPAKEILAKMEAVDIRNRRFDTSNWQVQAKALLEKSAIKTSSQTSNKANSKK